MSVEPQPPPQGQGAPHGGDAAEAEEEDRRGGQTEGQGRASAQEPTEAPSGWRAEVLRSDRRQRAEGRADRQAQKGPEDPDEPIVHMSLPATCAVGMWLVIVATVSVVGLVWMWTVAERVQVEPGERLVTTTVHWFGPDFRATESTAVLALVVFAAIAGSVVHMIPVFSIRVGRWTLEHGFGWWYLLRPFGAAALGPLFYMLIRGGLFAFNAGDADPELPVLVLSGALAGLFTDRVMQQMLALLGSTDPGQAASDQPVPFGPGRQRRREDREGPDSSAGTRNGADSDEAPRSG